MHDYIARKYDDFEKWHVTQDQSRWLMNSNWRAERLTTLSLKIGIPTVDFQTNLDNFIDEPTCDLNIDFDLNLDDKWDSGWEVSLTTATSPPPPTSPDTHPISFAKTRAKIFSKNMTVEKLATLMGGKTKSRIVNWLYVARTNGSARMLEFHQHQGTLDPEAVRW